MPKITNGLPKRKPNNPWSHKNPHTVRRYSVTDGRVSVGIVDADGKHFAAYTPSGEFIGKYRALANAIRALPAGKSS